MSVVNRCVRVRGRVEVSETETGWAGQSERDRETAWAGYGLGLEWAGHG